MSRVLARDGGYERDRPGELVHMDVYLDVKKLGRIPDGGSWRAHFAAHGITRIEPVMTTNAPQHLRPGA